MLRARTQTSRRHAARYAREKEKSAKMRTFVTRRTSVDTLVTFFADFRQTPH